MRRSYGQQDGKHKARGAFALDEQQLAAVALTVSTWRATANAERQQTVATRKVTLDANGM